MAMQGGFFGWPVHSGQGGAFRQFGDTKIAAFVVVNAAGAITDRDGTVVKHNCGPAQNKIKISALLANLPQSRNANWIPQHLNATEPRPHNTTLSLIVTNKKLTYAELQRLAIQVHTSIARAIQPFSTQHDGDTLFAISTGEDITSLDFNDLSTIAGEVMWNAILASVPEEAEFDPPAHPPEVSSEVLRQYEGTYLFGPNAVITISVNNGKLTLNPGTHRFFDLEPGVSASLQPISTNEFYIESRYHTRISFERDSSGKFIKALINPGRWQQYGIRESN